MGASLYLGAAEAADDADETEDAEDADEEAALVGGTAVGAGGTAVGAGGTGVAVGGGGAQDATTAPTAMVDNRRNSRREICRFILLSSFGIITMLVLYG